MNILSKKIIVRSVILIVWLMVIIFFLQLPRLVASVFAFRKTIYVATWPLLIDAQHVQEFEKETGIRVEFTYFERSEELYSKLKATGGKGYDLIFPSDYTVDLLIKEGLLKRLDKTKLDFWHRLDKRFLGNYFDPNNLYSIPFFWGVFGIGYNKKVYGDSPDQSWHLLFSPQARHIVMSDNPRESILIAAQHLFGDIYKLQDPAARLAVKELLKKQKPSVDVYTDERIDDLLSTENNNLAFGLATDISRAVARNPNIGFFIPRQGGFYIIDSVSIPAGSEREDWAYAFINYLYRRDVMNHHIKLYRMGSPLIDTDQPNELLPDKDSFMKMHFLIDVMSEQEFNDIWIDVLAD